MRRTLTAIALTSLFALPAFAKSPAKHNTVVAGDTKAAEKAPEAKPEGDAAKTDKPVKKTTKKTTKKETKAETPAPEAPAAK